MKRKEKEAPLDHLIEVTLHDTRNEGKEKKEDTGKEEMKKQMRGRHEFKYMQKSMQSFLFPLLFLYFFFKLLMMIESPSLFCQVTSPDARREACISPILSFHGIVG